MIIPGSIFEFKCSEPILREWCALLLLFMVIKRASQVIYALLASVCIPYTLVLAYGRDELTGILFLDDMHRALYWLPLRTRARDEELVKFWNWYKTFHTSFTVEKSLDRLPGTRNIRYSRYLMKGYFQWAWENAFLRIQWKSTSFCMLIGSFHLSTI